MARRYKLRTASTTSPLDRARELRELDGWAGGFEGFKLWRSARGQRKQADIQRDPTERRRRQHARSILPLHWLSRNTSTEAEYPPPGNLLLWQQLGAHDALMLMPPRVQPLDMRPCAVCYAVAWTATNGAYMTDRQPQEEPERDNWTPPTPGGVNTEIHIPPGGIPPALAAAWVQAAKNAPKLQRDATNESTGHYASADGVADQARKTLADQNLMWSIVGDRISPPTLAASDIGSRAYVGDVSLDWMLIHSSGAVLRGTSMAAVVAMKATPHDKAVQAAKTFLSGNVLRGLLCFVREDKYSTDQRLDREAEERDKPETCSPDIVAEVTQLTDWMSKARSRSTGRDVRGREVFAAAWKGCALAPDATANPSNMNPGEGELVLMWLRATKEKMDRKAAARQPGEDDPDDVEPPADWAGHDDNQPDDPGSDRGAP